MSPDLFWPPFTCRIESDGAVLLISTFLACSGSWRNSSVRDGYLNASPAVTSYAIICVIDACKRHVDMVTVVSHTFCFANFSSYSQ